jgi:hypothetical protein
MQDRSRVQVHHASALGILVSLAIARQIKAAEKDAAFLQEEHSLTDAICALADREFTFDDLLSRVEGALARSSSLAIRGLDPENLTREISTELA